MTGVSSWALVLVLALSPQLVVAEDEETTIRPIGGLSFADELELTIANLVVYVTDASGKSVTDLDKDDFEVLQDGVEQSVTNFQLYTDEIIRSYLAAQERREAFPTLEPEPAADLPEPRPVYLVLYIDNENLEPLARNRVLRQTQRFIRENLHPPAQMMVVTNRRSVKVVQPFTSDSVEVLSSLRSVSKETGGRTARNNDRRDILKKIKDFRDEESQRSDYSDENEGQHHSIYRLISGFAREEANSLHFSIESLRQVITSMAGLPGKKGLIYVSNGLPMIPGLDLYYQVSAEYHDASLLDKIFQFDRSKLYERLVATAAAQDVALYTISASGLEMGGMGKAEHANPQDPLAASLGSHNYTDSLRYMAEETGGVAVFNTNDVSVGLDRVAQDLYSYYSIGYPLHRSGKDVVHKVNVKLPNHPKYLVRFRQRFVEKSIETQIQDKLVSGLEFDAGDNPMHVEITTENPRLADEDRWMLPIHVSFPLDKVALMPEGDDYVGHLVLFVAVRDRDGRRSEIVRQEHELRLPAADYEVAQRQRFGIDTTLLMEGGRFALAVAIYDQITRQNSYEIINVAVKPELE